MKSGPIKDLTGQIFGRLTALRPTEQTSRGVWKWLCICSCSEKNEIEVPAGNLGRSRKSCGCLAKENARRQWPKGVLHRLKPGSLLRQLMGHYRQGAQRRKLSFTLTEEQFRILINGDCFYCGSAPSGIYRPTRYETSLKYNGIDRVENLIGYEFSNCVSCCKICNQMKSSLSVSEFVEHIKRIYFRHVVKEIPT